MTQKIIFENWSFTHFSNLTSNQHVKKLFFCEKKFEKNYQSYKYIYVFTNHVQK